MLNLPDELNMDSKTKEDKSERFLRLLVTFTWLDAVKVQTALKHASANAGFSAGLGILG